MLDLFSLSGRVALVTGASRGLGWAMAEGIARAGAHVVLNGRNASALEARVRELRAAGLRASAAPFDVGDLDAVPGHVARIVEEYGRLDVLVANAGMPFRKPLLETSTADWRRLMTVDLDSAFVLAREAAQPMLRARSGSIAIVSSIMGRIGRPTLAAYCAAKAGLDGLVRALAAELGPHGVRVNAIAPGYFATDATDVLVKDPEFSRMIAARTPLGRWGVPKELAGAAVFLSADAGAFVNGHVLVVDGGTSVVL